MAIKQITSSVQNDGNYCQLDLQDLDFGGPLMRIETFRCSQPTGKYGVTEAGTIVNMLAGQDHLSEISNRVFRHIFSVGKSHNPQVTLEIREIFDEDGSWEIRTRDLDPESFSFGYVLLIQVKPKQESEIYHLHYEIRKPFNVEKTLLTSPLTNSIDNLVKGLSDIGASLDELGYIDTTLVNNPLSGDFNCLADATTIDNFFAGFSSNFFSETLLTWAKNIQDYERFGDFRDKCVHSGTNLVGENPRLASEYLLIRAYRGSLVLLGRVCDPDMSQGSSDFWSTNNPLDIDPKPGVYSVFLSAHILGIGVYQLGIDKVHSDYGGIPMKKAPGSKLENGIEPILDSRKANETLAKLAMAFYMSSSPLLKLIQQKKEALLA